MSEPSPSEQRRLALAEAIARSWDERSIEYSVVHGLERYPLCVGRALDVALGRGRAARGGAPSALPSAAARGWPARPVPGLQRRWARSHPRAATRSIRDAVAGRVRRRVLNPAACVFVTTPEPDVVLDAAQELAREATPMFVDVRPRELPSSRVRQTAAEVGVWRAPPVSEFVVTVIVGRDD